jgi:hypothetical protein
MEQRNPQGGFQEQILLRVLARKARILEIAEGLYCR